MSMLGQEIYRGGAIDDADTAARLPASLGELLTATNGLVALSGAFHLRGAVVTPAWHSLREAWSGKNAVQAQYGSVLPDDVPFAEDAFGDQFLLRHEAVLRLDAETGEILPLASSLRAFLGELAAEPDAVLGYVPEQALALVGGALAPGQLIAVYPPFFTDCTGAARSYRALDALAVRAAKAEIARQIQGIPDGSSIQFRAVE